MIIYAYFFHDGDLIGFSVSIQPKFSSKFHKTQKFQISLIHVSCSSHLIAVHIKSSQSYCHVLRICSLSINPPQRYHKKIISNARFGYIHIKLTTKHEKMPWIICPHPHAHAHTENVFSAFGKSCQFLSIEIEITQNNSLINIFHLYNRKQFFFSFFFFLYNFIEIAECKHVYQYY